MAYFINIKYQRIPEFIDLKRKRIITEYEMKVSQR